jgi:hypothetical protein
MAEVGNNQGKGMLLGVCKLNERVGQKVVAMLFQ